MGCCKSKKKRQKLKKDSPQLTPIKINQYSPRPDNQLYDILGVTRNADESEVTAAYLARKQELIPDEWIMQIEFAYDVLSNQKKRKLYDKYGIEVFEEGRAASGFGSSYDFEDFSLNKTNQTSGYNSLLNIAAGRFMGDLFDKRDNNPEDIHLDMQLSLEEMYTGKHRKVEFSRMYLCKKCRGTGSKVGNFKLCSACNGTGQQVDFVMEFFSTPMIVCSECLGEGQDLPDDNDKCANCHGKGRLIERKMLNVHVPKGARNGQVLFFKGEGNHRHGNDRQGDVMVRLKQTPHDVYRRVADDLLAVLHLSISDALCGAKLTLKHPNGRHIVIHTKRGDVIYPGMIKVIDNKGMPSLKSPSKKGSLYIEFDVKFPEKRFTSSKQLRKLETLLPSRPKVVIPSGEKVQKVDMIDLDKSTAFRNEESDERISQCVQQ